MLAALYTCMIKQIINEISVNQAKKLLQTNDKFMVNEDGYLDSVCFQNQVIAYTNELGYSINDLVKHILKINGAI